MRPRPSPRRQLHALRIVSTVGVGVLVLLSGSGGLAAVVPEASRAPSVAIPSVLSSATARATQTAASLAGPVTGVLDDFNRVDGPLSGSWSPTGFVGSGSTSLSVVGQQVTGIANGVTGDFWNVQRFGPDCEVFVSVPVKSSADGDQFALALRMSSPGSSSATGYQAYFYNRSGLDEYRVFRRANGGLTQLAYVAGPELQAGDQLLFRAVGSSLSLWLGRGGSWSQLLSVVDGTFSGAGYVALSMRNTAFRLDNFGGGTLPAPPVNTALPVVSGSAIVGSTLTASTGTWTGVPAPSFADQWERCDAGGASCVAISGAVGSTYLVDPADAGSTLRVTVTGTNSSGSASASSATTGVVTGSSPPVNTALPVVSGSAQVGSVLSASTGTWNGDVPMTFAYQWQRCTSSGAGCSNISGATSSTYTLVPADEGATVVAAVTATNIWGSAGAASVATAVVAAAAPPVNTSPPTIAGNAAQGQTLTATTGTWTGSPPLAYAYQWLSCDSTGTSCTPIAAATQSSYTVGASDVGTTLRVEVTASNAAGTVYAYDSFQRTVQSGWGTTDIGGPWQILSSQSSPGPPSDFSVSDGQGLVVGPGSTQDMLSLPNIPLADADAFGAVSASAIPTFASPPNALSFDVQLRDDGTGKNLYKFHIRFTSGGVADILVIKTVAGTTTVLAGPKVVMSPYVPGTRIMFHARLQGSTLQFSGWVAGNPEPPWMISVTDPSLTGAQVPALRVDFRLITNNPAFTLDDFSLVSAGTPPPSSAVSPATALVAPQATPPANTAPPTISGTAQEGQTLTASGGTWTGNPTPSLSYQWQRCDQNGANCVDVPNATAPEYGLTSADVGSTIVVVVTGTNAGGSAVAASSPTAAVLAAPAAPVNTSLPTIAGVAQGGQTLTASPGNWTGNPAPTFAYQWRRCDQNGANCTDITNANASTYVLTGQDVGSTIVVSVTATNTAGSATALSAASGVVAPAPAPPVNTAPPTINGIAQQGLPLSASGGSWGGVPSPALTFQWQRCDQSGANCANIQGATTTSYSLVPADVGSTIVVLVTASNPSGSANASSAATAVVVTPRPATPVLDDFNRVDGPLSGPWSPTGFVGSGSTNLAVVGQQVTGIANGVTGDFWNVQRFGPDCEVFVSMPVKSSVDLDWFSLGLRLSNAGLSSATGYQAYAANRSAGLDEYKVYRRANGGLTLLGFVAGPDLQPGDQLLFRAVGSSLSLWLGRGGTWTQLLSVVDGTYSGAGSVALAARNTAFRLDNFGGGTLP